MKNPSLKTGFTTGAAAAAATKGALYFLLSGKRKTRVKIRFLNNQKRFIKIFKIKKLSDNCAECLVIKDAGDDPDITHKAQIGIKLSFLKTVGKGIAIIGGKGVGVVTKPGLELTVGDYAINPGPRTMILESVKSVYSNLKKKQKKDLLIEVFVPKGRELAKKTLNARLGIIGGISILGTTGIVRPMSHEAYIATIKASVKIAAAANERTLVYTTGRRSERFAMDLFPNLNDLNFIQTGDFFKASIHEAVIVEAIDQLIITVFFGKAVKMAMGFEHTHAAKSELTLKTLATWAKKITSNKELYNNILNANTARHAFSYISPEFPDLISCVGNKIVENAESFADKKLRIFCVIFDFNGNPIFNSKGLVIAKSDYCF